MIGLQGVIVTTNYIHGTGQISMCITVAVLPQLCIKIYLQLCRMVNEWIVYLKIDNICKQTFLQDFKMLMQLEQLELFQYVSGLKSWVLKLPFLRNLLTSQANSAFLGRFFGTGKQQLWRGLWNFKYLFLDHFSPSFLSQNDYFKS